jgi:hypothetical protein
MAAPFVFLGGTRLRRGKKLFESYKRRGEWVELLFMTVASGLGFNVAKPWGETPRYDVALEQSGKFLRIQVKSTEMWLGTCYLCQLYAYGQPAYSPKDVDYFAIYVFPEDIWYIFPAKKLAGKRTIALTPHSKGHKYEPYMENWPLLARPQIRQQKIRQEKTQQEKTVAKRADRRLNPLSALTRRIVKRLEGLDR